MYLPWYVVYFLMGIGIYLQSHRTQPLYDLPLPGYYNSDPKSINLNKLQLLHSRSYNFTIRLTYHSDIFIAVIFLAITVLLFITFTKTKFHLLSGRRRTSTNIKEAIRQVLFYNSVLVPGNQRRPMFATSYTMRFTSLWNPVSRNNLGSISCWL